MCATTLWHREVQHTAWFATPIPSQCHPDAIQADPIPSQEEKPGALTFEENELSMKLKNDSAGGRTDADGRPKKASSQARRAMESEMESGGIGGMGGKMGMGTKVTGRDGQHKG